LSAKDLVFEFEEKNKDYVVFLARVADYMASSVSRALKKRYSIKSENNAILKLWNPSVKKIELISSENDFKNLIKFINSVRNNEQYFQEYYDKLWERPEDFKPPKNITSLFTHSKLVGKLYRFFEANTTQTSSGALSFGGRKGTDPKHARENWHVKLVKGEIKFPHYPARVKDLNIFEILKKEINKFSQFDNVVLNTSTQFLVVLAPDTSVKELVKPFSEKGFFINVEEATTVLDNAYPTPQSIKQKEREKLEEKLERRKESIEKQKQKIPENKYKKLLEQIYAEIDSFEARFPVHNIHGSLPRTINNLCEVCQMQPSEYDWVDEESGITEHLCNNCYQIRKFREEPPAPKLDLWYKEEPRSKIAWIKINLDIQSLAETLQDLLDKYVQEIIKDEISEKIELRFSVLAEFQHDYELFLKDFNEELEKEFSEEKLQPILDDFICVKLDTTSQIKDILEIYNNLFTEYFPELKKQKSPVTLSISVSNVKFAFFRHWKILENPVDDVNVALVGRGEMHLNLEQLKELIENFRMPSSKQLHKLAKISETSEKLAKVLVYDKGDYRIYNDLKPIRDAKDKKIDFKTILTYAKIMGDVDEVS